MLVLFCTSTFILDYTLPLKIRLNLGLLMNKCTTCEKKGWKSQLADTTKCLKLFLGGMLALKRSGLVSIFHSVNTVHLQSCTHKYTFCNYFLFSHRATQSFIHQYSTDCSIFTSCQIQESIDDVTSDVTRKP